MSKGDSVLREAEIAARLQFFMDRAGITAAQLARGCGVSPPSVSEWLAANTEPTHENLAKACQTCGITLAEFWDAPIVVMPQRAVGG